LVGQTEISISPIRLGGGTGSLKQGSGLIALAVKRVHAT